jgi:hypothetical protein
MFHKYLSLANKFLNFSFVPLGIIISFNDLHLSKANTPIFDTEFGIVTDVSPLQPSNALLPISVTELGIVIDVNSKQDTNADSPIVSTEFGIVIFVISLPSNVCRPILVTELPMAIRSIRQHEKA